LITPQQVQLALELVEPQGRYASDDLTLVAERANEELAAWGHAGHKVALERVVPFNGDPRVLRWTFWCETCHVSQLALLSRPAAG